MKFIVNKKEAGIRLDLYLTKKNLSLSRTRIIQLIKEGNILVRGEKEKPGYKVKFNDLISVNIPEVKESPILPEKIKLDILYEDQDVLIINKPQGMIVHPAAKVSSGTLVNAILSHCQDLSGIGGEKRPGIVHRLDKDTSGVMIVAKNDFSHQHLSRQLKERTVKKIYLALVFGNLKKEEGKIEIPVGRHYKERKRMTILRKKTKEREKRFKEAITYYKVLEKFKNYSLLEILPKTGRTHQIRVHLAHIGYPVVGDTVYAKKKELVFPLKIFQGKILGQLLHSQLIGFVHPRTNKYLEFFAEMPALMQEAIKTLRTEKLSYEI